MRWLISSIILGLFITLSLLSYPLYQEQKVQSFCSGLPIGLSIADLRESTEEQGFDAKMEPFAQMTIQSSVWEPAKHSCRVFFNSERTVEYKIWQKT